MGTLHHLEPPSINVGAILTKRSLATRLSQSVYAVQRQGSTVRGTNAGCIETWERGYKNGGRLAGYTLLTLQDPDEQTKGVQICAGLG